MAFNIKILYTGEIEMNERHAVLLEIMRLANRMSREVGSLNEERSSAGISGVNARILGYLAAREGEDVFQRDVEEEFSIRRSTVSKIVCLMEQKGLVQREPVAWDARLKRLKLTERARQICAVASGELAAFETRATAGLTNDELQTLLQLLGKIRATLESDT